MTIQGAVNELISLLNADDIPIYYKGGIKKVIETIDDYIDGEDDYVKRRVDRKTESQVEMNPELIDKPIGYEVIGVEGALNIDEPQYDTDKGTIKCDNCSENGSYKCSKCDGEMYFKRLAVKDEPQTERSE